MTTEIKRKEELTVMAKKLNSQVYAVIGSTAIDGFEKAFLIADAIKELKELLTAEYMSPIMYLMGNKLGFLTDKDRTGGYVESQVKNCLIEAVLYGLNVHGNQFNIISGQMYPTKEGLGQMLKNISGLRYEIVAGIPKAVNDKTSSVEMTVKWSKNDAEWSTTILPISVKIDSYASVDSVIGKATRKARKWLYEKVTGVEVTDGEIQDVEHKVVESKINEVGKDMTTAAGAAISKKEAKSAPVEEKTEKVKQDTKKEDAKPVEEKPNTGIEDVEYESVEEAGHIYTKSELDSMGAKDLLDKVNELLGMKTQNVLFVGDNKDKKVVGWLKKLIIAYQDNSIVELLKVNFKFDYQNTPLFPATESKATETPQPETKIEAGGFMFGSFVINEPGETGRDFNDILALADFQKSKGVTKEELMGYVEQQCLVFEKLEDFLRRGRSQDVYTALKQFSK